MKCHIQWQVMTRDLWDGYLSQCPHTTILQAYYYAQAMRESKQQGVRHGIILIDDTPSGIVQIQEVGLFKNAIHTISIDRGPLWFDGFGSAAHLTAFAKEFDVLFPARFARKRRVMLEYYDKNTQVTLGTIQKNQDIGVYKTFLVDISHSIDVIRQNFNKKWRNCLSKSEKTNIYVTIDAELSSLSGFLRSYVQDRAQKGYSGASASFLATLCKYAARNQECYIFNAKKDDEIIAAILIFTHGRGATYQTGWTTDAGRATNAHHLLFWHAIKTLKEKNITEFDLGGHNDETEGLVTFKKGLGGHEITLIGSYS